MVEKFGVTSRFQDFTTFINASSLSSVSFAGAFSKGAMDQVVKITNIGELESVFGIPDKTNRVSFLMAQQCLLVSNNMNIIRIATTGSLNATSNGSGILVKNKTHFDDAYSEGQASVGTWIARSAGTWGNSLKVSICPANTTAFNAWEYKGSFKSVPTTSNHVSSRNGALDEMHIAVVDIDGKISGTPNTVIERFEYVSQASDAVGLDGTTNYYKDVINAISEYVYLSDHPTSLVNAGSESLNTTFTVTTSVITDELLGGNLNNSITLGEYQDAYTTLIDDKLNRADFVIAPPLPSSTDGISLANYLIAKAEVKQDFVLCLSPRLSDTVNTNTSTSLTNVLTFLNGLTPSKFATSDTTSVKVFDPYNGSVNVSIPGSANLASTFAYTNRFADVATSNAGSKRGQYYNVSKLNYDPSDAGQKSLIGARGNPVISSIGRGIYLNGDLTLLDRDSVFNQTSVVTTFITLNRAIKEYAESFLFEKNDSLTDLLFRQGVTDYLETQVAKRIIQSGSISKGKSNNPNEYIGNIYIQPISSIRYLTLNFIAVKGQGVNISVNEGIV